MDPKTYEQQQPLIAQIPQVPLLPQHIITSGTRKDCIRLRGLPYEAQVEHILEFLGEHAKNIVFQGVHMVYNAQVVICSLVVGIHSYRCHIKKVELEDLFSENLHYLLREEVCERLYLSMSISVVVLVIIP